MWAGFDWDCVICTYEYMDIGYHTHNLHMDFVHYTVGVHGDWWPTVTLPRMLCICHPCAAPTICRLSSIHPTHTVVYSVNGDPPMEDVSPGLIRPQIDPPYTVNFGWGLCNGCCVPAILMLIPLYRLTGYKWWKQIASHFPFCYLFDIFIEIM